MRARRFAGLVTSLLAAAVVAPAAAEAAAPSNDQRAEAAALNLPATVSGTVVGATVESDEPASCDSLGDSVWYRFTAPAGGRVVLLLDAAGDLDAVLDIFRRSRSNLVPAGCDRTDRRGQAILDADDLRAGATYLIRVAGRAGSPPDSFRLQGLIPKPPAEPPGRPLPAGVRREASAGFRIRATRGRSDSGRAPPIA
jgi:hypothetical protein